MAASAQRVARHSRPLPGMGGGAGGDIDFMFANNSYTELVAAHAQQRPMGGVLHDRYGFTLLPGGVLQHLGVAAAVLVMSVLVILPGSLSAAQRAKKLRRYLTGPYGAIANAGRNDLRHGGRGFKPPSSIAAGVAHVLPVHLFITDQMLSPDDETALVDGLRELDSPAVWWRERIPALLARLDLLGLLPRWLAHSHVPGGLSAFDPWWPTSVAARRFLPTEFVAQHDADHVWGWRDFHSTCLALAGHVADMTGRVAFVYRAQFADLPHGASRLRGPLMAGMTLTRVDALGYEKLTAFINHPLLIAAFAGGGCSLGAACPLGASCVHTYQAAVQAVGGYNVGAWLRWSGADELFLSHALALAQHARRAAPVPSEERIVLVKIRRPPPWYSGILLLPLRAAAGMGPFYELPFPEHGL